jgi:hypothetical protein
MLYIALKSHIFLIGVIPIGLLQYGIPKEWYDMLFGSFYLGRNRNTSIPDSIRLCQL